MKYVCKRLAAMAMVLICLAAMLAIPASAKTDLPTVISQAKEGVVKLFVVGFSPDDTPAAAAVGSGFAVGQKGSTPEYFVTNWHVASAYLSEYNYAFDSDHVRIWIMLDNFTISDVTGLPSEATSVECSIVRIAESGYPDYAILRAARPVTECKPLAIRSSESVKQGETVVALGCPAVVDDLSATVGSNDITATRGTVARHMVMSAAGNTNVLLHDAVISGGNSGGGQNSQTQQGGGGVSQPSANAIQQVLQQIAQGAQNGGGSQMPKNQKASNVAKQATKDAQSAGKKKGKKGGSGSGGNDANKGNVPAAVAGKNGDGKDKNEKQEQADNMLANVLQTIISSVAGDMAEAQMEQDLKSQIIADVDIMDRSSTHKGHKIDVKREVEVTPANIKLYGEMMEDVKQYSKRLAKLMQQELKDLQDGDVRRNRMYGRDIVANDMWRPDCRYFSDTKLPQDLPDMAVAVLVDQSGSMCGQRMGAAMKATMLLHDYAERVHVPVAVYGHNVTMHGRVNLFVYTDFLKAGKRDKYRLAKLSTGGCNRDGAALEVVANLLNARPERTKLLIIISDGKPNDDSYGGDSAAKDIKDIVARNRRRGVEIVAAAIGDDKAYLKKIYGDQFLDITDLSTFPKAMVKIVKKRLKV